MNNKKFVSAVIFAITMMFVGILMIVALFATLLNSAPTYAAAPPVLVSDVTLPMVAFEDNQLKLFGFSETPQVIDNNTNSYASNHVWSPNGDWLAYITMSENGNQLMLADTLGRTPQAVATGLNSGMPIQFTTDNSQLIYAIVPNPDQATSINGLYTVEVMSQTLGSAAPAVKLGSFEQASCGGGGPSVYDALYWIEAGTTGIRPILVANEFGIIHSVTCQGVGVAVMNTNTGVDTVLDAEITKVKVSPDGQILVGVKNNQLMIINIVTGEKATFATDATPDQVIWGATDTGNIYYSVRQATDEVVSFTATEQQTILNATGVEVSELAMNKVTIHRFNLETGNDDVVYENTAYAIGHMTLLPDNRLLMVSEVPSLRDWFHAVLQAGADSTPQLETELYLVSLENAETRLLGTGLLGARLNNAAYVRTFGISPQISVQPASATVGTQLQVTGTNFPPQSRVSVFLGANANSLDETAYASGFTNTNGEATLSFKLPSRFANGQALGNGQVVLVGETADGLFSAEARITINTTISNPVVNTNLPTPVQPVTVSISPYTGTVGTQININGQGFPANQRVNIHLGNATAGATNAVYASATSDANGAVSLTFNMPGVYADGSPIQASQVLIVAATDNFSHSGNLLFNFTSVSQPVTLPSISLSPTTLKPKEKLTISGKNFAPNTTINILMGPNANDLRGNYHNVKTDGNGNFETTFELPERWNDAGKINSTQITVVASPSPSGTSASATLGIKLPKNGNNGSDGVVSPSDGLGEEPSDDGGDSTGEEPTDEEPSDDGGDPTGEEPSDYGGDSTGEEPSDDGGDPTDEEPADDGGDSTGEEAPASVFAPSATVGETVMISGSGFAFDSTISIQVVIEGITTELTAESDESGMFSASFVPESAGLHTVTASSGETVATNIFTVE